MGSKLSLLLKLNVEVLFMIHLFLVLISFYISSLDKRMKVIAVPDINVTMFASCILKMCFA